tara:strand:- start:6073 stop:7065 length:993 start_codon:yes stop_codon:yes gene_type:complete
MRKTNLRTITGNGSVDTITTSYEGQYLGQIISAALLSGDTIEKGGITVKPNVKYKEVVKKLETTGIVTDATCDFTVTADQVTLSERILQVEPFNVNLQLCKKDFLSDYLALEMGNSAYKNLPTSFADYIMAHVAAKVAEKVEQNIWGGVNANAGEFDGLTVLAAADADVNDVPGVTATAFTAANIIDELGKVVDAIPGAVYGKEDLHLYLPTGAFQKYVRALGGFGAVTGNGGGANGVDNRGSLWYDNGGLTFEGIKVFKAPGMPADHIVAAEKSNLFFGTALLDDMGQTSAKVLDMADLDGSDNVRIILRFQAGVQYGNSGDLTLYTLA